ncbi:MAG: CvpA family protein [Bacteroidia bacterium]|nr:CvpA family protein [Bacteroidia bacterium]
MNAIDIVILIPLLWGAYKGFTKGLIVEVASIAALLMGVYGALKFSGYIAGALIEKFGMTTQYTPVISFAVTFVIIVAAVYLIAKLVDRLAEKVSLGIANKILGAIFGIVKFALILSIIFIIFNKVDEKSSLVSKETKEKSLLYNPLARLSAFIFPALESFKPGENQMQKIKENIK